MANMQRQIDDAKRNTDIARDNMQILGSKAQEVQRALMEASQTKGTKTKRLEGAIEKVKTVLQRKQKNFEEAQKEFTKAQDNLRISQELYSKLEHEYQIESRNEQNEIEHTRTKLERELSKIQRDQKAEMARMNNASRDVTLLTKRDMEQAGAKAAKDTHASSGHAGRRQTYY